MQQGVETDLPLRQEDTDILFLELAPNWVNIKWKMILDGTSFILAKYEPRAPVLLHC